MHVLNPCIHDSQLMHLYIDIDTW